MEKLSRSPLVLVVMQVRFSRVLAINEYITSIQNGLRKTGYPLLEEEILQEITFGAANSAPEATSKKRWIFTDISKKKSLILTDNFVAFETSAYDVFQTFLGEVQKQLLFIGDALELSAIERIGLRYVNLIREIDGRSSRSLFQPMVLGLGAEDLSGKGNAQTIIMSQIETGCGTLAVRILHSDKGMGLPPDLAGTKLNLGRLPSEGEPISILDIDHFSVSTAPYEVSDILNKLTSLHEVGETTFVKSVTPEALKIWK